MPVNLHAAVAVDAWLRRLWRQECALCGGDGGTDGLCAPCRGDLPPNRPACVRCAAPVGSALALPCGACLRRPPPWHAARVPFRYDWPLDGLITAMKFGRRLALAATLGAVLADALDGLVPGDAAVVPVPLHRWRLAARGFNQAAELAAPVARRLGLAWLPDALTRVRATPPQSGLSAARRRANLRNAFAVHPRLRGRDLVLVDDVVTTGSTATAVARACRRAGVGRITLVALARA